jgi:hypothetical protein
VTGPHITNGCVPDGPRDAARYYIEHGLAPVPIPTRSKAPVLTGWPDLRLTESTLGDYFPAGQRLNLGLLTGRLNGDAGGEVVVDLDCPEALRAADLLLPRTGRVAGRPGNPRSHRHYRVEDAPAKAHDKYKDPLSQDQRAVLVELLSTGAQVVAPPSIHPNGELYCWDSFGEPATVPIAALLPAVRRLAAAALLGRSWPTGGRHDAALALSGGLLRAGWNVDQVKEFVEAVCAAAQDPEASDRLRAVEDTAAKLAAGENVTGWPTLAAVVGDAIASRVRQWLGRTAPAPGADRTPAPPPWPDPPAAEAFHGLAGQIVRAIEPASEADPAALLVQTLVAFGNALGRTAHFPVEADRHHGNEFIVLVGKTSKARKGTSWGRVNALFREAEEQWAVERVQSGASSGEGIIWAVRDPIHKPERVKEKGGPVRYEIVEADPGVSDKRLLVYEPEFANVLKQTERHGNTLSAILRQAWDGNDLRSLTKNSPAQATGAHVSLIGHITAEELRRYLTQTETANGFGNRHLFVCTDRSKLLPEGGRVEAAVLAELRDELVASLGFARGVGEVTRDDEARAVWREVYGPLSEGKPGLAGALLARAEAHVLRLAMLYALLDRAPVIRAPHLLAALALWDYCERSVYHIFGDTLGDPVADELLRLLRSCPHGLTRTEIRDYFQRNASADRIGRALGLLLQHGLARCERQETGGRPVERWFAVTRNRTS